MLPRVAAILTWADVRVQVLFGELKFSVIESQYFTGPVSVVGLWVCTFLFEWDGMVDHGEMERGVERDRSPRKIAHAWLQRSSSSLLRR